jgi:hypothetical protein
VKVSRRRRLLGAAVRDICDRVHSLGEVLEIGEARKALRA